MANGSRVILQEPESGLDIFLREIARYASPQYQLSLREQERADARLELSKRQMDENEERYQDSLRQQKFRNDRAIATENIAKERFEINKRNSEYAIARQNIDDSFSGMNPRQLSNANIESLLIGIEDPTVKLRSRKYAESLRNRGRERFKRISSTLDIYNSQNPESPMTLNTALDVFKDDESINKVLNDAYFSKGDLSDMEKAQISTITPRLTSLRKQQQDLLIKSASDIAGADDALAEVMINISNLQKRLDSILQTSSTQRGESTIDAYETTTTPKTRLVPPVELFDPIDSLSLAGVEFEDRELYDTLFSDDEDIAESAIDIANRNVSEENVGNVIIDTSQEPATELDEGVTKKDIEDMLAKAKEQGKKEEVTFLESALSGLSSLDAMERKEPDIETVEAELFSNVRPTRESGIVKEDGSFVNVERLSSSIGNSLRKIKGLKDRYKKADGNSKLIIAKALTKEQSNLQEIKPFISKEGTFSNKSFNDKFYERLSKRTNIPIDELKSLILFNMDYNI